MTARRTPAVSEVADKATAGAAEPVVKMTERLDDGVRRSVLPDGTVVLTERMDSVRSAAVGLWVRSGTAHEDPELRGISHLLEHMVFKGTGRRSAHEIAATVEGTGGSLDAYTTHEHTAFQVRVPADHLETGLDVLSDLAFEPVLRQADLDLEREVVLEEIARVEDTPDDLVFELHSEFMYGDHPYGSPILGTRESVNAIGVRELRALHETAYRPGNVVVAAAGQVDHEDVVERVLRLWPQGRGELAVPDVTALGVTGRGRRVVDRPGGRQVHIVAGCRGLEHGHPLRHAVLVVGQALGGGMSSRLFQQIRERLGLAYSVFSFQSFYAQGGHIGAYLGTRADSAEPALDALLGEFSKLASDGLSAEELAGTREQIKGQILLSLESPAARMNRLAATALFGEPYRTIDELAGVIDSIGPDEAASAASLYDPEGVAVLELRPS